jgi:hypothetical protein
VVVVPSSTTTRPPAAAPRDAADSGAGRSHAYGDPKVLLAIAVTTLLWALAFVAIRSVRTHYAAAPLALGRLVVGCSRSAR